jgi:AcrR family transcriptional regulator
MAHKVGRPKTGQPSLTRERILAAALQLVVRHGVAALSMRRLAAELGVDPMAIYYHLPGKRALLAGLVELVFNELQLPPAENRLWPDQVRAFARAYRHLARAHPNLVLYLVTDVEAGIKAVLAANEYLYAALVGAGLTPRLVISAANLLVDYLNGFALAESSGQMNQPGERQVMLDQLEQFPPERFPTLRQLFGTLTEEELGSSFEAELDLILAGIVAFRQD